MVNAEDMVAMETCGPQPACVRCSASGGWCVRHNLGHPPQSTRPSPHRRLLSSTSCCRGPQHTHPYTFSPPEHRCRHRTKPQTPASTAAFAMPGMCIPVNVRFCPPTNLGLCGPLPRPFSMLWSVATAAAALCACATVFMLLLRPAVGAFMQCSARRRAAKAREGVPSPGRQRRVAVIGAGPAGLTTCRELLQAGHLPVLFEARSHVGGVFAVRSCCRVCVVLSTQGRSLIHHTVCVCMCMSMCVCGCVAFRRVIPGHSSPPAASKRLFRRSNTEKNPARPCGT